MTFRSTLQRHLKAIRERNLAELVATLPEQKLVLIMADGRLVSTVPEFVDLHRDWFRQTNWSLQTEVIHVRENFDLGVAVVHLDYREQSDGKDPIHQTSFLTLTFARDNGKWVMVQDQNTPIRSAEPARA